MSAGIASIIEGTASQIRDEPVARNTDRWNPYESTPESGWRITSREDVSSYLHHRRGPSVRNRRPHEQAPLADLSRYRVRAVGLDNLNIRPYLGSWDAEVSALESFLVRRAAWMDAALSVEI